MIQTTAHAITRNELYALLRSRGIHRASRSLRDYERAKWIIQGCNLNAEQYFTAVTYAADYIGV